MNSRACDISFRASSQSPFANAFRIRSNSFPATENVDPTKPVQPVDSAASIAYMPCPDDAYLLTTHHYGEAAIASVQAESHFEGIVVRELHAAQIGNAGSGQLQEVVDRIGRVVHDVQMVVEDRQLRNHLRYILDPLNQVAERAGREEARRNQSHCVGSVLLDSENDEQTKTAA